MSGDVKPGIRPSVPVPVDITLHPWGAGLVPTDGVQYSDVATFGTVDAALANELISLPYSMDLMELEVGLTQRLTELTDAVGSLNYWWQAREEYKDPVATLGRIGLVTGAWLPLTGTYSKGIGSLANSEDTFAGRVSVASLPHAPFRIQLRAAGLVASTMTGEVKSSSYVRLIGNVIPGT